eukprot:194695-Pleurochrysis_carterae.AAC.3
MARRRSTRCLAYDEHQDFNRFQKGQQPSSQGLVWKLGTSNGRSARAQGLGSGLGLRARAQGLGSTVCSLGLGSASSVGARSRGFASPLSSECSSFSSSSSTSSSHAASRRRNPGCSSEGTPSPLAVQASCARAGRTAASTDKAQEA